MIKDDRDKPKVFFENGTPMTTSLEVARIFEKEHFHVMDVIRNVDVNIPNDFHASNFRLMEIIEENAIGKFVNKSRYHITEKGFMFIGMKLGGRKADLHRAKVVTLVDILREEIAKLRLEGPAPQPQIEAPRLQIECPDLVERPGLRPLYRCGGCHEWLLFDEFDRDNHRNPPRQSWCRQCHEKRRQLIKDGEWTAERRKMIMPRLKPKTECALKTSSMSEKYNLKFSSNVNPPASNQVHMAVVPTNKYLVVVDRARRELEGANKNIEELNGIIIELLAER